MTTPELSIVPTLTEDQAAAVRDLVLAAPDAADSPALSEHALLHLTAGVPTRHLLAATDGATVAGYAQLEDLPDGSTSIELVTALTQPADAVRIARLLLGRSAAVVTDRPLLVWAHGEAGPVSQAATALGFRPVRSLFQLRRSLDGLDTGVGQPPPGVTVRAFVAGRDDAGWLAVNAAAFAHHPEQGGWTQADLDARLAADWFDAQGFLVAERDSELIGYHWTKVHPATATSPALGEVYVLGVAPAAQGLRLGSLLLRAGLQHLRERGLRTVLLYVDESNTTAVRLYRSLGFTTYATDVQYSLER